MGRCLAFTPSTHRRVRTIQQFLPLGFPHSLEGPITLEYTPHYFPCGFATFTGNLMSSHLWFLILGLMQNIELWPLQTWILALCNLFLVFMVPPGQTRSRKQGKTFRLCPLELMATTSDKLRLLFDIRYLAQLFIWHQCSHDFVLPTKPVSSCLALETTVSPSLMYKTCFSIPKTLAPTTKKRFLCISSACITIEMAIDQLCEKKRGGKKLMKIGLCKTDPCLAF